MYKYCILKIICGGETDKTSTTKCEMKIEEPWQPDPFLIRDALEQIPVKQDSFMR